jgi:hypothetical protein
MISLARSSLLVLPPQQDIIEDAATEKTDGQVTEDDGVAHTVVWGVLGSVDVGTHYSVEISPADDYADCGASLIHTFDVVGNPGDCVGDTLALISIGKLVSEAGGNTG